MKPTRPSWKNLPETPSSLRTARRGNSQFAVIFVCGSVVLIGLMAWLLMSEPARQSSVNSTSPEDGTAQDGGSDAEKGLTLYCAAGIKPAVAQIAQQYAEEEFGTPVSLQYGGSGTLLSNLRVSQTGDLYLAADDSYIDIAVKEGLVKESLPVAKMTPVIITAKGNPKKIASLDDLKRDDVNVALANPDAASIGKLTKKVLEESGHWKDVEARTKVFKPTVMDITNDVRIGTVDAAIVWDAVARQQSEHCEMVKTPELSAHANAVTIGVLASSRQPTEALRFARYMQAPEKGGQVFSENDYEPVDGDAWAVTPTILFFSGGVNRLAIQDTLRSFQEREGIEINVQYNGCGILVGQMKLGEHPDAYFACDSSYMVQVRDIFGNPLDVAETDMLIIAKQGNPLKIAKLEDLTREGLKLGIANEEQSALGALTHRLLGSIPHGDATLWEAIQPNIKVQTPTADLLVNQLRAGDLDASIVYRANVSLVLDKLEAIPIKQGNPLAVQPIARSKETKYPYLVQRMIDAITSASSQSVFESRGFRWRGK